MGSGWLYNFPPNEKKITRGEREREREQYQKTLKMDE